MKNEIIMKDSQKVFINPDFNNKTRVHDWKNYTTKDVESLWDSFNDTQKIAIGEMLDEIASNEDWD